MSRVLRHRTERGVDNSNTASVEVQESVVEPATRYAPADFLRQFGGFIAVCLGLALLAQVLVSIVGVY